MADSDCRRARCAAAAEVGPAEAVDDAEEETEDEDDVDEEEGPPPAKTWLGREKTCVEEREGNTCVPY